MSIISFLEPHLIRARVKSQINRLKRGTQPIAGVLVEALIQANNVRLSHEEMAWINRIEEQRNLLLADNTSVTITDFGAGSKLEKGGQPMAKQGQMAIRRVGQVCRAASKSRFWSLFLFKLTRTLRPMHGLELGTCLGISTAYQAAALALNGAGSLTTIEGAEPYAKIAQGMFGWLGLKNITGKVGRFQDVLPAILSQQDAPFDYVFIDGHHDGRATVGYFQQIVPHVRENTVFVFDDIFWSDMRNAWNTIQQDERVTVYADLYSVGLCLVKTGKGR